MKKYLIAAILAFTSISFSDETYLYGKTKYDYQPIAQRQPAEYKPDKKNCDLCVNFPRKRKTIQV
jgi:hypothetical protein